MSDAVPSPRAGSLRLIATLAIAGLFSGISIVVAYRATLPRIQANQRAALERAVFEVLPGTVRLERLAWDGAKLAAGEAGKGFAVVANEVKELAQETSKATEDIGQRIQAIQTDTEAAVTAINEISTIIAQINDTQAKPSPPARPRRTP